ncbi:PilX N-terminal domain-containing pilus assembly protein [Acidobacteriota bacterium]
MNLRNNEGIALITAVILLLVLFVLGTGLIILANTELQISKSFSSNTKALYIAEAGIHEIAAHQNDPTASTAYFKDDNSFQTTGVDPYFVDMSITDPQNGKVLGTCTRQVINGKDPRVDDPPYRIRATASTSFATRILEADLKEYLGDTVLGYSMYSEVSLGLEPGQVFDGHIYADGDLTLSGTGIVFNKNVEYVNNLVNSDNGSYNGAVIHPPSSKIALTDLVDLNHLEQASKQPGKCGSGAIGLYIGPDTGAKNNALFERSSGVYQIDLTLFNFSGALDSPQKAIEYDGTNLIRFDHTHAIKKFNGVIFVEGELHIWGINGGRSVEDFTVLDQDKSANSGIWYPGPNGLGNNNYSNNVLDSKEDGDNGGESDGKLDPAKQGFNLTIVTASGYDIYIDHNIFTGQDFNGRDVNVALISGDAIYVSPDSPKTTIIEASLLALGEDSGNSFIPAGNATTHQDNYWAELKDGGDYIYDVNRDGIFENNNHVGQVGDRNETDMLGAWSLILDGNLVTTNTISYGQWSSGGHIQVYRYNESLQTAKPSCYPCVGKYDIMAGTWVEIE